MKAFYCTNWQNGNAYNRTINCFFYYGHD